MLPPSSHRLTTNMKSIQLVVIPYLTRIQEYCRNKVKKTLNMLLKEYHLLLIFTIEFSFLYIRIRNYRKLSLEQFISDYNLGRKRRRYVNQSCLNYHLMTRVLKLILGGHFLFTYSHKFEFSFILSSIT